MIQRLYVHNFRCLENFTFVPGEDSTALLIGRNGSGKSTILNCFRLLQTLCRGSNRVSTLVSAADFAQHRPEHPIRIEVDLVIDENRYAYAIAFEWPPQFHEARILEERLSVDGQSIFSRQHAQVSLSGGATFGLDWHVAALPIINHAAIPPVRFFFAFSIIVAPIPDLMAGFSEQPSPELSYNGANLASCLKHLLGRKPAAYGIIEGYLKETIPDFSSLEYVDRGESGSQLIVKFEQQNPTRHFATDFIALSSGEKCYFLSAYLLALQTAGYPVFCFWDEPDNHLSLSEVGQFIIALRRMAHHKGQFLATTHHPETIRKFSDETTFVLTRASHLDPTVIRPLSDFRFEGDLINALIRNEIIG
ncbi:MAG: AAA family ATPase [Planctomycetaceae bacterium]|nr:AAA family ATPase [Planctomycetaceae bacterium]